MDVLAYSAFNQQIALNQQIVQKTSELATKCSETAALQAAALSFDAAAVCWLRCIEPCLLRRPTSCSLWNCIPTLTGSGFKVCRSAGNTFFNYGACCQWTVPAGATRARFQIWGAGGGSGAGCCCGGSVFGSSGAYASVIIPVTAGSTYTLCAGCASCCFGCGANPVARIPGCPSFVTGTGLCNFCANGGQGSMGTWMAAYGKINPCRINCIGYNYCGPYLCNGGADYCYSSSCACTGGVIPYVAGASYFGTTTSTTAPSIVYGIRGSWPTAGIRNYTICQDHPPIYCLSGSCTFNSGGSTCAGCFFRACCGILQVPGAGGFPTVVYGGCTSARSDFGRGGMVCVTFC